MDAARLDAHLSAVGVDGYLIDADGEEADQRYLSGFDAPDPYLTLYTPDALRLLVSELEYGRARRESAADEVARLADFGYADKRAESGARAARRAVAAEFLADAGVHSVAVPGRFPLDTADGLRERGVTVEPDEQGIVTEIRAVKTDEEVDHVRAAQRANEAAMARAEALIAGANVVDGALRHEGEPLTAETVKQAIEMELLRHGCGLDDTIVAGGAQGADPHDRGSGPLPAHEPVVVDVFPRSKETHYHADMTRTFVRGEPTDEVRRRFAVTLEAMEAAFDAIEPGVTGAAVHDAVCDVYEAQGYDTLRSDPSAETGFIHGTGHGVGLDVHELPRLSPAGEELEAGNVVTVEPGLYDPEVGGMRVEDFVLVTEDGYENLVDYPKALVVGE
mgnify:CR=1 FL=1